MPTRKRYYEDCHLTRFSSPVTGCRAVGAQWEVTLEQTAFYPEGGGQACDIGTLGGVRVLDVQERGEEIIHLCDGPLTVGSCVEGEIDYARRFDLMQQHTGEHIISGIVHRLFGFGNSGFHVGREVMEVDFDGVIPAEALPRIEAEANRAVWENIPLRCWVPEPEELPQVVYRTKRALPWPVRIVQVPGYDSCACCGIHVGMTGEVGLIKILSCVKFHSGVRLELVCGERAYRYMARIWEQNRQAAQAFSARPLETGEAARKMNEALSAEKYRCTALQSRILKQIAESYVNQEAILHFEPGLAPGQIRELAERLIARCTGYAAVFSGEDGKGYGFCLASGREDLRPMGKALTGRLRGRGGGKPQFQQGAVEATEAQIRSFFEEYGNL